MANKRGKGLTSKHLGIMYLFGGYILPYGKKRERLCHSLCVFIMMVGDGNYRGAKGLYFFFNSDFR